MQNITFRNKQNSHQAGVALVANLYYCDGADYANVKNYPSIGLICQEVRHFVPHLQRQGTFFPTQLKRKPALPIDRRVKPCMRGFRGDPLTIKSDKRTALAEEYQATGTHRGLAHLFIKRSDSQLRTWRPLTVLHIEAVAHPP